MTCPSTDDCGYEKWEDYEARVSEIADNLLESDKFIDELISNDDAIIASLRAMFKAGYYKTDNLDTFMKSAVISFNQAVYQSAVKKS